MKHRISDIARATGIAFAGDGDIRVRGLAEPQDASAEDLAVAGNAKYAERLPEGAARAALLWEGADWEAMGLAAALLPARPRYALSALSQMMDPGQGYAPGIHETAIIDPSAKVGDGVSIGPFTIIGANAVIGDHAVIGPQVFIGTDSRIGPQSLVHAGARIMARVRIGARAVIQPGATLGGDGFSFVTPETSHVERARETLGEAAEAEAQAWARIHSLGGVTLGDDVEVGANSSIDRGTIRDTVVGSGTKIDSLVQVGHNVVIGENCLLCAQAGVAGSTRIGRNTVLGGQVGVADNLSIGENVICGGGTVVLSNIPAGRVMLGYPAMKMSTHVEAYKALRRLPRLLAELRGGRKPVSKEDGSA